MIRILHVFGKLNRGGAETMVMNLYHNIDRDKIQFDFVVHTDEDCDYFEEIKELGGRIYTVPRYRVINHFKYKKAWSEFFKKHPEYKIIHGHVRSTALIYLKIAKKYGLKTISHSHSTSSGSGIKSVVKNILQFPIRYIADYFFACSKEAGLWLYGRKTCENSNFYIVKNAIDIQKYRFNIDIRNKIRKEFNLEDKFVIGHIGRFVPVKNHTFLIDVFYEIYKTNKDAVLFLIGDGELKEIIMKKVKKLNIQNSVIFTGVRNDVPMLLQAMDVFVFPSLHEGLGLVLIEAQAANLKCVVSDKIPTEAFVTPNIKSLSLKDSINTWKNEILNCKNDRTDYSYNKKLLDMYDIKHTSKWIFDFYSKLLGK